jgi:hypothetical protein
MRRLSSANQLSTTTNRLGVDAAESETGLSIRNRRPSGDTSYARYEGPRAYFPAGKRACGVPGANAGVALTGTAIISPDPAR